MSRRKIRRLALAATTAGAWCAAPAWAGGVPTTVIDEVTVTGQLESLHGAPNSANQGVVTDEQLSLRPVLRTGELMEVVPGLIVTQHSGDGKANQFFLRGFNLDHARTSRPASMAYRSTCQRTAMGKATRTSIS